MGKNLYIAEKPSVAREFARVLRVSGASRDGYIESGDSIVTWCVGHLITMCYPESYDPALKKWRMETLPFIPEVWKYTVIDSVKKQFGIVKGLLNRSDVETIYVCTDSGREGEYIYRLVRQEAGVSGKKEKRVWIDSQTEEEILRGIREAKDISAYDSVAQAAYLRAKEDYLMGINFSRALTLKFGDTVARVLHERRAVISVGRVMTCVLGMVVRREREIRAFVPTPFYRVVGEILLPEGKITPEWRAVSGSDYFESPLLYKENGFRKREDALKLIGILQEPEPKTLTVLSSTKKTEKKNPPLLFNLAELQNECSKRFRISPDAALQVVQELYEKKLVTYPRTDARVLSTAVAKEIDRNIRGLASLQGLGEYAKEILEKGAYRGVEKSVYTDDKKITDHYAIIPTGQGISSLQSLAALQQKVYELIVRRFLCIFFPPAVYEKYAVEMIRGKEHFFTGIRSLSEEGYLRVYGTGKEGNARSAGDGEENSKETEGQEETGTDLLKAFRELKKGTVLPVRDFTIREGETTAPKRYSSGSLILAMENAGQLIEDEELRSQIRGSGIGTSATRAEILKKLQTIGYIGIHQKTQTVTPCLLGEMVFDVVDASIRHLLNAELTASWEKGLSGVADGTIAPEEYMEKLRGFVTRRTEAVRRVPDPGAIEGRFRAVLPYYSSKK